MLGFNGVEAAIAIDGVELPRYRVQHDNLNNTVTCWIPSEAGKAFSILWSSGPSHHSKDTSARVWIDGALGDGLFQKSCNCRDPSHIHLIDRVTVSSTTAHPMVFSESVVGHPDYENDDEYDPCKDLGQIVVTINEAQVIRYISCSPIGYTKNPRSGQYKKKLSSHEIRLEEGITMSPPSQSWSLTKDTQLLAKFIFKYQPLDLLIAEGIAPANLYKRKLEDDDPEVDDQARWEAIQNSIVLLDKKFAKKGVVPFNTTVDNSMTEDNPEYDSDLEHDENAANGLRKKILGEGHVPAKKMKLVHDFKTSY